MGEFYESILKLSNHVEDNVTKKGVDKPFQYFNLKLEKLVANDDLSVMDEDLQNKNMEDMAIFDNSLKGIMKNYLGIPLHTNVEVLKIIDDDELKFEVKECGKKLEVNFIGRENITLDMDFSFAFIHHKLNFEVYMSKTSNFMNRLSTMLYLKYLFF
jgi:hypothetical protein